MISTVGLPLLALLLPTVLSYFNGKIFDEFLLRTYRGAVSDRILIVDVDENSLRVHGQWPWPRYKIAAILDRLTRTGAASISLDMIFPEKDRTSLAIIREDLRQDLNVSIGFEEDIQYPDNDLLLADAIFRSPVVLGYQFLFDVQTAPNDCRLHPLHIVGMREDGDTSLLPWHPSNVTCNLSAFASRALHSGFFNVSPDADGILRRVPLFMAYGDQFYPSLALASVMMAAKIDQVELLRGIENNRLVLGKTAVPLDSRGALLVNYKGKGRTYPYISAADLLAGNIQQTDIKDKIVFVSTSAAGLKEFRSTPTDPLFPGVEVHATVADNLLTANFLTRPSSALGIESVAALVCGFLYVFATAKASARRSLLIATIAGTALWFSSYYLFNAHGIYISPILPLIVLIGNFALLNLLKFRREEVKSRQQTRDLALAQAAIIESMAALTETRDPETGGHIKRTQEYVRLLARALRHDPAYSSDLSDEIIDLLHKSAPLHDIGKVGVPDRILLKPDRLSTDEFEEMKKHATIGSNVIAAIQQRLGDRAFLRIAHEITFTHHEKWDGSGYPRGLKGEQIPLSGRLMAIADMYDALTSGRVYKKILSHEEAVQVMTDLAAASFDPRIFAIFLEIREDFHAVARKLADPRK